MAPKAPSGHAWNKVLEYITLKVYNLFLIWGETPELEDAMIALSFLELALSSFASGRLIRPIE